MFSLPLLFQNTPFGKLQSHKVGTDDVVAGGIARHSRSIGIGGGSRWDSLIPQKKILAIKNIEINCNYQLILFCE